MNSREAYSAQALPIHPDRPSITHHDTHHWRCLQAHYLVTDAEAEDAKGNYNQLISNLEGYMRQMHNHWSEGLATATADNATWADKLNRPLMVGLSSSIFLLSSSYLSSVSSSVPSSVSSFP